jgi:hypothetical protein
MSAAAPTADGSRRITRDGRSVRRSQGSEGATDRGGVDAAQGLVRRLGSGTRAERGRSLFTETETGTPQPGRRPIGVRCPSRPVGPLQFAADTPRTAGETRDVVADVDDARWPGLEREKGVEAGDAVGLGGRHAQAAADLVEGWLADPADARLDGVERRQQEVAPVARRMPSPGAVAVDAGFARPGDRLDRGALDGLARGRRRGDPCRRVWRACARQPRPTKTSR